MTTQDILELAARCEAARDTHDFDTLCRELHEIDERPNVNGSCAAYMYDWHDAKRLLPKGHCILMASSADRVWVKVTDTANDEVKGYSALGANREVAALCAAALKARAHTKGEE